MSKINSINNSSGSLTIDPGASGDSAVQFSINGTPEFIIGVDDTDDSFRISAGSALGTTDCMVIESTGEATMPLQSCFSARSSAQSNVTGDSTVYTVTFTAEEYFDQNNDFDGTSTFTAPVTGKFLLCATVKAAGITTSHTLAQISLVTTARTYTGGDIDAGNVFDISTEYTLNLSLIVDMTASDTATVAIAFSNGTKVVDIGTSYFSGCLIA